jgi:ADP-ribose pyrophosphatase
MRVPQWTLDPLNRGRVYPGDATQGEIEIVEERLAWPSENESNPFLRVYNDHVRFPRPRRDGTFNEGPYLRLTYPEDKGDGVVVVPILPGDRILLLESFRHSPRLWMREVPRGFGFIASDESSIRLVPKGEIFAETGYNWDIDHQFPLGRVVTDSGKLFDVPFLFACRVTGHFSSENQEAEEAIRSGVTYRFQELRKRCWAGDIIDAFTLAAVLRLEPHFQGDRFAFNPAYGPGLFLPEMDRLPDLE